MRRLTSKVRRRIAGDVHRGAKIWPVWLEGRCVVLHTSGSSQLCFPRYLLPAPDGFTSANVQSAFDRDDPEYYLFRNRWGECLSAVMEGGPSARSAIGMVTDWIRKPLSKSDPAWEPYSSCERVANLAVLLSARPECVAYIDEREVRLFFEESLRWINDHLEYYGAKYTNNHILNNARGLVIAGTVLNCMTAVERGLVIFAQMARALFQNEGFLRERSSHYQVIVTNWLLDTVHFARIAQVTSDAGIRALADLETLATRVTYATSLLHAYMGVTNTHIGDISPDVHPHLSLERLRHLYPSSLLTWVDPPRGRKDDWVFVSKANHALVSCVVRQPYPLRYTTHGHSDLGGFVWSYKGMPILVDAGRSRYTAGPSSLFQVGPRGHNTVLINGLGALAESLFLNAYWYPEPYSSASISVCVDSEDGFTLTHRGFARLKRVGAHVRRIRVEGEHLAVYDQVEGAGTVVLETFWHFPPHLFPAVSDRSKIAGVGICVTVASEGGAGEVPTEEWQSYPFASAYGEERPASMLRLVWSVSLPCLIKTVLRVEPCVA